MAASTFKHQLDSLFSATTGDAFAVGTCLALYLLGKIKTRQATWPMFGKPMLVGSPVMGAWF